MGLLDEPGKRNYMQVTDINRDLTILTGSEKQGKELAEMIMNYDYKSVSKDMGDIYQFTKEHLSYGTPVEIVKYLLSSRYFIKPYIICKG
jgi:hypothetical protein